MTEKTVCELAKNTREAVRFRLKEFKGHRFVDLRVFALEDGKDPAPTKKGLAVSPAMWAEFRRALAQVDQALIEAGWLDKEDLG